MSRAPHERSIGAQMERKALRAYLRRQNRTLGSLAYHSAINELMAWVLSRQARYDKKRGGLGR